MAIITKLKHIFKSKRKKKVTICPNCNGAAVEELFDHCYYCEGSAVVTETKAKKYTG